jgi:signal transduction histidine kinase
MNWLETWLKNSRVQQALRLSFAILITVLLVQFKLDVVEFISYDLRAQWSPKPKSSGQVVLVSIEPETLKTLQHAPEALEWTRLLENLKAAKPVAVVSFINPVSVQGKPAELKAFADTATSMPFIFGEDDLPQTGQVKLEALAKPFDKVEVEPAPKTWDIRVLARDGVTRRSIVEYQGQLTLHPKLANIYNGKTSADQYAGTFNLLESTQVFIRYRKKGAFPVFKFSDVLNGKISPETFQGKIVLIGRDSQESNSDYVTTPLNKELLGLTILEMHANVFDTLILDQAPRMAPDWTRILITFLICMTTMFIVLSVRPGRGLLMLGAVLISYCFIALALFAAFGWIIPVAHPLVVVFICYYFIIPYRLIVENRRSWEYYQKNKLLTQVEELKSNFMRMMSHDLKTPLARIQGMTEFIQKESNELSESQKKALDSISESSDELTEFIGSILSLSRIESKEVKLQLRSKDINQLVPQVVRKFDYMAKRKHIEIVTELEEMFSVKMDKDLIRQVLSNLLENAIKYSPEGSKVLITTEEVNGEIVVQVADQGRGIPQDEIPHVFTRFFRGRETRGDVSGSGLGLYLAKYFVDLHHGRIEVESEIGKGSTFTVRLPMALTLDHQPFQQEKGGPHA